MGLSRRQFTREFKLAAVRRLEAGVSITEVARALEVKPNLLHRWRSEFRQGPGNAFPGHGQRRWSEGRIAELERKIGQPPALSTLRCVPRDTQRKTRGRADRYSFLVRNFHPLLHAGCSENTYRLIGSGG